MKTLDARELAAHRNKKKAETAPAGRSQEAVRGLVAVPVLKGPPANGQESGFVPFALPEKLAEATGLAHAIGLEVRFAGLVPLQQIRPATLFGAGKVEEIGAIVATEKVSVVVIDHALSPIQQRNLEKAWNAKVLDRTGLILEIFAGRAQSKEGRLQVELARLTYQKSRLVRSWTHLERQRGGFGFLGGPGETQIEADRRAIGERIDTIKSELGVVERTRRLHRKRRKAAQQQIVSLVGYTNAGKSTLFNALSGAGVLAQDMLFATLDPTLRRVNFADGGSFILSDTVGFISNLPTQLIAAFRSTLEEILEADVILHVRDIASASSEAQRDEVYKVLSELGMSSSGRIIEVWNKTDLLPLEERVNLFNTARQSGIPAVPVSAAAGEGLDALQAAIRGQLRGRTITRSVVVDQGNGQLIHWLYENTEIVDRRDYHDGSLHFRVRVACDREKDLDRHLHRPLV